MTQCEFISSVHCQNVFLMCLKCIPVFLRVLLFHALCVLEHITHRLESGQSCKITPALCGAFGRVSGPGLQWPPPAHASEDL